MATTAPSVETRVRVERLEKSIAIVLLERASRRAQVLGSLEFLWEVALLTRVANSADVKFERERRCRGEE